MPNQEAYHSARTSLPLTDTGLQACWDRRDKKKPFFSFLIPSLILVDRPIPFGLVFSAPDNFNLTHTFLPPSLLPFSLFPSWTGTTLVFKLPIAYHIPE
ncbi:hypothetical protein F5X96DRAFT_378929 [Biscogniauxia mediterranea]|nr:hypothetical protein F5X96DRAFT_378929 [Biscogniauxia mediterranea]